jgi:hypothetical protein
MISTLPCINPAYIFLSSLSVSLSSIKYI